MSAGLKALNRRELERLIREAGWSPHRNEGDPHVTWIHTDGRKLTLAGPSLQSEMGGGGLKAMLKRFGVEIPEKGKTNGRRPKAPHVMPAEDTFGRRIWDAREAAGMSQADLARHLKVHQALISTWERNLINPFNAHGEITYQKSKLVLGAMARLFGWSDIAAKAGVEMTWPSKDEVRTIEFAEPKHVLPAGTLRERALADSGGFSPDAATRMGHQAKDFISLIRPADVMQAMSALEDKVTELEGEVSRLHRSDLGVLRWKADAYDRIKALIEEAEAAR